jgi:uncharacterized membrane protein
MHFLAGNMMNFGESYGNGYGYMMGSGYFGLHAVLGFLTWLLVIVALVAFIRWMWKKGDKVK